MNYENATDTELNIRLTSLVYKLDGWECTPMGTIFFHCGVDGGSWLVANVQYVKATMKLINFLALYFGELLHRLERNNADLAVEHGTMR